MSSATATSASSIVKRSTGSSVRRMTSSCAATSSRVNRPASSKVRRSPRESSKTTAPSGASTRLRVYGTTWRAFGENSFRSPLGRERQRQVELGDEVVREEVGSGGNVDLELALPGALTHDDLCLALREQAFDGSLHVAELGAEVEAQRMAAIVGPQGDREALLDLPAGSG